MLGHKCDRYLWLTFRWAVIEKFSGRMLRLFQRGQDEEARVIRWLRNTGLGVDNTGRNQSKVDFGCHVSGSIDGVLKGVHEDYKTKHILEIKTHSKKSFDDLVENGVQKSKPMHFVQMQVYMLGSMLKDALYFAVCKDDDRIYTERVRLYGDVAEAAVKRGKEIALSDKCPPPMTDNPSWYECKFCPAHDFCFGSKKTKEVNCRTCAHSSPFSDSTWHCRKHGGEIPVDFQRTGCDAHVIHQDLVDYTYKRDEDEWKAIFIIDGKRVKNGVKSEDTYTSREILANPSLCANPDDFTVGLRKEFGGEIR